MSDEVRRRAARRTAHALQDSPCSHWRSPCQECVFNRITDLAEEVMRLRAESEARLKAAKGVTR